MMSLLRVLSTNLFIVLLAGLIQISTAEDEITYNNEIFPRDSAFGKLQERLIASELLNSEKDSFVQERANGLLGPIGQSGQGVFANRPLVAMGNRFPLIRNPEFPNILTTYDACTAPTGEGGICLPAAGCTAGGGRAAGSCFIGTVCCINAVSTCSGTVTLNNTYWQTPSTGVTSQSTCSLTVRLNQNLPEQKKAICQVRLDFVSFSIAQPAQAAANNPGTCATDSFQVSGPTSTAPVICGDNNGQHMYLTIPSSGQTTTDVQLLFSFGAGIVPTRSWNIQVRMLPCGASFLAPADCLQYFTGSAGAVKSFNWADSTTSIRQLANQNYNVCFRTEIVGDQRANSMCLQPCVVTNAASAFLLTGPVAGAGAIDGACTTDFAVFANSQIPANPPVSADRFCGGTSPNFQACSTARPFKFLYHTDAGEVAADVNNSGFCLNYLQRVQ